MKTKRGILLGLSTIFMSLGVMLFGVYAAISANLNISGSLGFNMHNCTVSLSGSIKNIAITNDNGLTYESGTKTIMATILGGETQTSTSISLGDLYFFKGADGVSDIVFSFTFTNVSDLGIKATIPAPTLGSGVSLIDATNNASYTETSTQYVTSIASGESSTIIFAIRLNDSSAVLNSVSFSMANITFEEEEEFTLINQAIITNTSDNQYVTGADTTYYYISMGKDPTTGSEIRWIPFAVSSDGTNFTATKKTVAPVSGKTYYFVCETVLATIPYHTNYYINDNMYAIINDTNYQALDYACSDARKYLNGNEIYSAFESTTGPSNMVYTPDTVITPKGPMVSLNNYRIFNSYVYKKLITFRPLAELYSGPPSSGFDSYNTAGEQDKLWLLSESELELYALNDIGNYAYNELFGITRNSSDNCQRIYSYYGDKNYEDYYADGLRNYSLTTAHEIRPGFQITIP